MNAFISYSHQDQLMLTMLHKHLTQLQRDGVISAWTDREIMAGGEVNKNISSALSGSDLFIALLSPDYIASKYCYEIEFQTALKMQEQGMIIIPVIVEPCDWLSTPFKEFKALPTDGKAITLWENKNTAFLDITQNLRKLTSSSTANKENTKDESSSVLIARNYRVQKDFDSIEKIEFVEKTLHEVKEYIKRYIEEITKIDNVKTRTLIDNNKEFESLLVNRNKIATEAHLKISINSENSIFSSRSNQKQITYSIIKESNRNESGKSLTLSSDEYHLFWLENNFYSGSQGRKELGSKEIAELIWNEWLESVGIL